MISKKLLLVRHGESQWNKENRFTGWTDIDLSSQGVKEATAAGKLIKKHQLTFDFAFTSLLKRAIRTLWLILEEIDQVWLPVEKSWKLNERHYGSLQGMSKTQVAQQYGAEQVWQWRRGFSSLPPALITKDKHFSGRDNRYAHLTVDDLPASESLAMTVNRVLPYWNNVIQPRLVHGEQILIVAHQNSLRALIKCLNNLDESEVTHLTIPTGVPLLYEFDDKMQIIQHEYLTQNNSQ